MEKKSFYKSHKPLCILLLCILAVILALAILTAVFFGSISGWTVRTFGSGRDLFLHVERQRMDDFSNAVTAYYNTALYASNVDHTAMHGSLRLSLGDPVICALEETLSDSGISMDMDWIRDSTISVESAFAPDRQQILIGFGLNGQHILSADVITDSATGRQYVAFPELNSQYLTVEPAEKEEVTFREAELRQLMPAPQMVRSMLRDYYAQLLAPVETVEKYSQTIQCGEASQEVLTLRAEISRETYLAMQLGILEKARQDPMLRQMIEKYDRVYFDRLPDAPDDLYADFLRYLSDTEETISQSLEAVDSPMVLETYLAGDNAVLGRKLTDFDGKVVLEYLFFSEEDYFQISVQGEEAAVSGSGTWKDGTLRGTWEMTAEDAPVFRIHMEDMTIDPLSLKGIVRIETLGQEEEMTVTLTFHGGSMGFSLESHGELLLTGELVYEIDLPRPITVPEDPVDISDYEAGMKWMENADFGGFTDRLRKAGLPKELLGLLGIEPA